MWPANEETTGALFEISGGWAAQTRWQRAGGHGFPINKQLTPEDVASKWKIIGNFGRSLGFPPISSSMGLDQVILIPPFQMMVAPQTLHRPRKQSLRYCAVFLPPGEPIPPGSHIILLTSTPLPSPRDVPYSDRREFRKQVRVQQSRI